MNYPELIEQDVQRLKDLHSKARSFIASQIRDKKFFASDSGKCTRQQLAWDLYRLKRGIIEYEPGSTRVKNLVKIDFDSLDELELKIAIIGGY